MSTVLKAVKWIGSSLKDLREFPMDVREGVGYALYVAQAGGKAPSAKPLKGFDGAGVLEIVEDHDGNTYRAVYTVRFSECIYVLHCFQKKSKTGIGTPQRDKNLIETRLKIAQEDYAEWLTQWNP
jgi:phage-related protein